MPPSQGLTPPLGLVGMAEMQRACLHTVRLLSMLTRQGTCGLARAEHAGHPEKIGFMQRLCEGGLWATMHAQDERICMHTIRKHACVCSTKLRFQQQCRVGASVSLPAFGCIYNHFWSGRVGRALHTAPDGCVPDSAVRSKVLAVADEEKR